VTGGALRLQRDARSLRHREPRAAITRHHGGRPCHLARFDTSGPVALFFVAAMVAFFAGLLFFLREIFIATANLRIGPH
jgi:hypothetical protein